MAEGFRAYLHGEGWAPSGARGFSRAGPPEGGHTGAARHTVRTRR